MKTVKSLLKQKGSQVWCIAPDAPVFSALQLMAEKDIGALVVVEHDQLAGIFSERDYARKVILKGKASRNTPVKEIMTADVITVRPQQTIEECLSIMERHRIRYLPVLDRGRLLGMISISDVLHAMISEQAASLIQLEGGGTQTEL
jgi:CBS domain-containing protein